MSLHWVATCKECGEDSAVRPSASIGNQLELINPDEEIKAECKRCHHMNDFRGSDLREVRADILPFPPPSKAE
jgi:hypothetical protein